MEMVGKGQQILLNPQPEGAPFILDVSTLQGSKSCLKKRYGPHIGGDKVCDVTDLSPPRPSEEHRTIVDKDMRLAPAIEYEDGVSLCHGILMIQKRKMQTKLR